VRLLTRNTQVGSVWTEEVEVVRKVRRSSQMPRRNGEIEGEKGRLGLIPCREDEDEDGASPGALGASREDL
jgi:hypothetical protein